MRIRDLLETASTSATASGNIASVSSPLGAVIKRMPPGQSFFGYQARPTKTKKKTKKRG